MHALTTEEMASLLDTAFASKLKLVNTRLEPNSKRTKISEE